MRPSGSPVVTVHVQRSPWARTLLVGSIVLGGACRLEETPLLGPPARDDGGPPAGDGDADADADGDGDADADGDGDGDGDGDADPACVEAAQQACGLEAGECQTGRQTCRNGAWGPCEGAIWPAEERCNGRDDDCDGLSDTDDSDADDECSFIDGLAVCTERQNRSLCAYHAPCIGCSCDEAECFGSDFCDQPAEDCGSFCAIGCVCAVCYHP